MLCHRPLLYRIFYFLALLLFLFTAVLYTARHVSFKAVPETKESLSGNDDFGKAEDSFSFPLDLNSAGEDELTHVKGIGPVLAERIVDYRRKRGMFRSTDELLRVKGIGPATYEKIKPFLTVEGGSE
jgi:competence protein ComEA